MSTNHEGTYSKERINVPSGWFLDFSSKWTGPQHNDYADDKDQPVFKRKGTFAGNETTYESVHRIELRSHYNGSGEKAFGGAKRWPAVESHTAFNEKEYELAVKFAQDLGEFINRWMNARGR